MTTDLTPAWIEWHETCELDKCSPEHIADLCRISDSMFHRAISILQSEGASSLWQFGSDDNESENEDDERKKRENERRYTFHLMENNCLPATSKEERQQFKDQIFSKVEEPGMVTGYFLRDFFRSFVKNKNNISYNMPTAPEGVPDSEWEDKL